MSAMGKVNIYVQTHKGIYWIFEIVQTALEIKRAAYALGNGDIMKNNNIKSNNL